jgi:hypothetical protein
VEKREALKQAEVDERVEEVDKIIALIEERLADEDVQLSVADLMRLLELRRELARSQPGSTTVGWIDECQLTPGE